jgi:hypothetical protein
MIAERIARKEAKERAKVEKAAAEKAAALEVSLSVEINGIVSRVQATCIIYYFFL